MSKLLEIVWKYLLQIWRFQVQQFRNLFSQSLKKYCIRSHFQVKSHFDYYSQGFVQPILIWQLFIMKIEFSIIYWRLYMPSWWVQSEQFQNLLLLSFKYLFLTYWNMFHTKWMVKRSNATLIDNRTTFSLTSEMFWKDWI